MPDHSLRLPFWEGFTATKLDIQDDAVWITLCRDSAAAMVCGRCGAHCYQVHDVATRIIRELPMQGKPVRLRVPLRRLKCSACGTRPERVSWLDRHARVTSAD